MAELKLLVTTGDLRNFVSPDFHYLVDEVSELVDLTVWYEPGDIHDILRKLDHRPDFIFINEFGELNSPAITGLRGLDIPWGVYLYDIHFMDEQRKEALKQENVPVIFSHYKDRFFEWYGEFSDRFRWLPQHANTNLFKDYQNDKTIDYLLMGAVDKVGYPLRYKIVEKMRDKPGFVYHEHPGYRYFEEGERQNYFIGERYAQEINRAKIFMTDHGCNIYPIAKYFEAPACRTLLLAANFPELAALGFEPGENFVAITEDDFEEKAEYYLRNEKERIRITERGYEFIHAHHSTKKRAQDLVRMIKDILKY